MKKALCTLSILSLLSSPSFAIERSKKVLSKLDEIQISVDNKNSAKEIIEIVNEIEQSNISIKELIDVATSDMSEQQKNILLENLQVFAESDNLNDFTPDEIQKLVLSLKEAEPSGSHFKGCTTVMRATSAISFGLVIGLIINRHHVLQDMNEKIDNASSNSEVRDLKKERDEFKDNTMNAIFISTFISLASFATESSCQ